MSLQCQYDILHHSMARMSSKWVSPTRNAVIRSGSYKGSSVGCDGSVTSDGVTDVTKVQGCISKVTAMQESRGECLENMLYS